MFEEEETKDRVKDCIKDLLDRTFPGNPGDDDEELQISIENTAEEIIDVVILGADAPVH